MLKNKASYFTIALLLLLCHISTSTDLNDFALETDSQTIYQKILAKDVGLTSNTTNSTTTNGTENSTTINNTNITYCNNSNGTNCTLTQQQIIIIINNHGKKSFFFVIINGQAVRCPPSCIRCSDGSTCTTCRLGFAKDSSNRCVPCRGCFTCSATNTSECLSCFSPQTINQTTKRCEKPIVCLNKACQSCSSANLCTSCYSGYSLYNNSCLACTMPGCNKCTTNIDNCDSDGCGIGFVYFQNSITSINQCNSCTAGCAKCEPSNLDNCLGCISGYYSAMDNTKNPAAYKCAPCLSHCVTCLDGITCTECADGYITSSDSLRCVLQCSTSCFSCQQNLPNNCLSCTTGYTYDATKKACTLNITVCNSSGTCQSCPHNHILSSGQCFKCNVSDSNCQSCLFSNLTTCSSCYIGNYLNSNLTCESCPQNCDVCLGEYTCTQCSARYYLESQNGGSTGKCQSCERPCLTCYKRGNICSSCIDGHTLIGSSCRSDIFVSFKTKININMAQYNTISNYLITYLISICSKVRSTKRNMIFIFTVSNGSADVSGGVSADSSSVSNINKAILSGFAPGTNIQGSPVISTTTTTHDNTQQSSANLGLILGISIPLLVLLILVLVIIGVRMSKKNKYQQYEEPHKNQTEGYINNNQNQRDDNRF